MMVLFSLVGIFVVTSVIGGYISWYISKYLSNKRRSIEKIVSVQAILQFFVFHLDDLIEKNESPTSMEFCTVLWDIERQCLVLDKLNPTGDHRKTIEDKINNYSNKWVGEFIYNVQKKSIIGSQE